MASLPPCLPHPQSIRPCKIFSTAHISSFLFNNCVSLPMYTYFNIFTNFGALKLTIKQIFGGSEIFLPVVRVTCELGRVSPLLSLDQKENRGNDNRKINEYSFPPKSLHRLRSLEIPTSKNEHLGIGNLECQT